MFLNTAGERHSLSKKASTRLGCHLLGGVEEQPQMTCVYFYLLIADTSNMSMAVLPQELCGLIADHIQGYQAEGVLQPQRVVLGLAWGPDCYEEVGWYGYGGSCNHCGLKQEYFERGPNGQVFISMSFTPGHFVTTCSQWCSDVVDAEVLRELV